jgi:hypothetical protein
LHVVLVVEGTDNRKYRRQRDSGAVVGLHPRCDLFDSREAPLQNVWASTHISDAPLTCVNAAGRYCARNFSM